MRPKGFSERDYAVEFGRYEGIRPVEPPAHELLIAREGQRAHFLNLLLTVGRKGAYLVTGHRGSGKTTFVRFCLDEYQENVYRRYLASNVGRAFLWDRVGTLALGSVAVVTALLLTEAFQQIAALDKLSPFDWIVLAPLLLLCFYPILIAKEFSEIVFADVRRNRSILRWVAGFRPDGPGYLGVSFLALLAAVFWHLGQPALAVSQLVLLAGWLFLVTNLFAVTAWRSPVDPGPEDPSFDLAPMGRWQKVPGWTALLVGIVSVYWWPALPAHGWVWQNWFFGLILLGCGAFRRYQDQKLRGRHFLEKYDGRSGSEPAVCDAMSGAAKWHLLGAIVAIVFGLVGTAINRSVFSDPEADRFGWAFAAAIGLSWIAGWLWRAYQRWPDRGRGTAAHPPQYTPFRLHPASRVLMAFKALAFLVLGLQLSYPLAALVCPQLGRWLDSAQAPSLSWLRRTSSYLHAHPKSLMALSARGWVLFTGKSDEILWAVGVILLMAYFVFAEYEWIIRPYSTLRDDEALHVRERRKRAGDMPSFRAPSIVRLDYQRMAKKTFFWSTFTSWLPVLRVPVNLGSDILEYRYVIEGMLAGLKHEYHRTFLHWSSPLVAIRRGLALIIVGLLALFAGQSWFGVADPTAVTTIHTRTFCQGVLEHVTTLNWLTCRTGGERLLQFVQWAPLGQDQQEEYQGRTTTAGTLLVDRVVAVRDVRAPRLRELRIYHLLVLVVFYFIYIRLWRANHLSPYRQTYDRISRLLDSLSSRLREESRPDRSKVTEWLLLLAGRERIEAKEFAPFDPRTVELTFLQILADSQDPAVLLPFTRRGRISPPVPEIVFIFDELDKISGLASSAATPQPKGDTEGGEGEPRDLERERGRALHRLFSDLKNILSSGRARFIFLGGRNLHDEWLADQSARRPLLTNTFDAEIHLPSLLTEEIAGKPAGTALEGVRRFVDEHCYRAAVLYQRSQVRTLAPWLKLWREDRKLVSFVQGPRSELPQRADDLLLLDERWEKKIWSAEFAAAFVAFLGYRSRGNVKKLQELLEGFIRPVQRVIVGPEARARYNCEHVLLFHDTDRFRIQLVADIYRQVEPILEARLSNRDDKLSDNVLYLSDYLLKFHRRAFTWSNLGRVDELVHIHRAPDLRPMLEDMVLNWSEGYLHLINNGMYDYRFESHFARELEYLSRQSEHELAAFNFTLDESQQLKATYRARLASLKEQSALDFIIGFGELHEFDEEFEIARYYYRWAVRALDEEFHLQAMKQGEVPISFAVLAETEGGYEAARRISAWGIARVRLMMQIAMTYERARDLEHAQVEYRDARTLASAIIRGLLGWQEGQQFQMHLVGRQSSAKGYLWTLKHLNILFQPLFAEAWLAEKSVGGVDTGPSLLERELWELRRIFPFEGAERFSQPRLPESHVEVQHSNFSLIFAELHAKAGSLYFFKGRQLAPAERTASDPLHGTEGYLLIAQSHYAASLHEVRRFNFYRRESSHIKFNDIQGKPWDTIREGGWAEFVYRIGAGALCNLGEALLGRVSLVRLFAGELDAGGEGQAEISSNLGEVYEAINGWLEWSEPSKYHWPKLLQSLFPSCKERPADLSEWFGEQPDPVERVEGQLLRFPRIHGDNERLATSLLFSLAGAHLLEDAGYFEGAAEECLRVVRTAVIYIWWIRMVQVLSPMKFRKNTEAAKWNETFVATTAGRGQRPAIASDLIGLAVERLEHIEGLYLRGRRARVLARQDANLLPPTLSTYACALALGVLQIAPHQQQALARLRLLVGRCTRPIVWAQPEDDRFWFRRRLWEGLDRHSFPMFNRLVGLKVLIDDALLEEIEPENKEPQRREQEREEVAAHIDELIRLERLYKSPLHFTPLHSGLTLGLACLLWRERVAADTEACPAFIYETARQQLVTSQQMVTLKRSYYEAISGLYYLYDDFNDRTIHFNHAIQMSGIELASFLLACLDPFELPPEAPVRPRRTSGVGEEELFAHQRREWEEMAAVDPYFAILNQPTMRNRRWERNERAFFGTGEKWVAQCMARLAALDWRPEKGCRVLDFGCGVGRVAGPLAARFESVVGVDFSRPMIVAARVTYWFRPELVFHLHQSLTQLPFMDGEYDCIVCIFVLQHQADERLVERWLHELIRVLKPGGALVFQLPYAIGRHQRRQWKRRAYQWLRALRVPAAFLIRCGMVPIGMLAVTERRVRGILDEVGGHVLAVDRDDGSAGPGHPSSTYYVSRSDT